MAKCSLAICKFAKKYLQIWYSPVILTVYNSTWKITRLFGLWDLVKQRSMSCSRLHQAQLHRCCVVVTGGTRSLPCCCCVGTFTWRCQPQATACSSCSLPSLSADNTSTTCPCLLTSLNIFCQNNAGIYHIWKPRNIMLHNLSSMRWSSAYNLYTESRILFIQKECWNDLHTRCPPKKWGSSSVALLKQ